LILVTGLVVALIAYFMMGSSAPPPDPTREPKLAAIERQATVPPLVPAPQREVQPTERQADDVGLGTSSGGDIWGSGANAPFIPVASLPIASKDETVMLASRSEVEIASAGPPIRKLGPSDVELFMNKGQQYMAVGDVAAARVIFERAAEAGGAGAALAMGTTYDPLVLKTIGALGITADPDKARSWYEQAQDLGSPEALQALRRLELLANR
jgi:hypothetical protein